MDDAGRGRLLDEGAVVQRRPKRPSEGPDEVAKTTLRAKSVGLEESEEAKGRHLPIEHLPTIVPDTTTSTAAPGRAPRLHLRFPGRRSQRVPVRRLLKLVKEDEAPSPPAHKLGTIRVRLEDRRRLQDRTLYCNGSTTSVEDEPRSGDDQ